MDVCTEVANISTILNRNLNVTTMNLLQAPIVCIVVERIQLVICYTIIDSSKELTKLLRAVVRIRAILIKVVLLRRIGSVGNLTIVVENQNCYRDIHKRVRIGSVHLGIKVLELLEVLNAVVHLGSVAQLKNKRNCISIF